jgi:hypothetical protein
LAPERLGDELHHLRQGALLVFNTGPGEPRPQPIFGFAGFAEPVPNYTNGPMNRPIFVIPAKAGIQGRRVIFRCETTGCRLAPA